MRRRRSPRGSKGTRALSIAVVVVALHSRRAAHPDEPRAPAPAAAASDAALRDLETRAPKALAAGRSDELVAALDDATMTALATRPRAARALALELSRNHLAAARAQSEATRKLAERLDAVGRRLADAADATPESLVAAAVCRLVAQHDRAIRRLELDAKSIGWALAALREHDRKAPLAFADRARLLATIVWWADDRDRWEVADPASEHLATASARTPLGDGEQSWLDLAELARLRRAVAASKPGAASALLALLTRLAPDVDGSESSRLVKRFNEGMTAARSAGVRTQLAYATRMAKGGEFLLCFYPTEVGWSEKAGKPPLDFVLVRTRAGPAQVTIQASAYRDDSLYGASGVPSTGGENRRGLLNELEAVAVRRFASVARKERSKGRLNSAVEAGELFDIRGNADGGVALRHRCWVFRGTKARHIGKIGDRSFKIVYDQWVFSVSVEEHGTLDPADPEVASVLESIRD